MASSKKMIGVRFSDDIQAKIDNMREKLGLSQAGAVAFLVAFAIREIEKGNREIITETIFDSTIDNSPKK